MKPDVILLKRLALLPVIILGTMAMLLSPVSTNAQMFQFESERTRDAIDFTQIKNLIIIPVYINEAGPYNFLLDTGVGQMIITDTTFLKVLKIDKFKTYKIQGYGLGKEIEAVFSRNITARVGNATIKNIPAAIFKHDLFNLSSFLGIKIHGILGFYFFNSFIVRVNYSSKRIIFSKPQKTTKTKGVKLPIRILNLKPYLKAEISLDSISTQEVNLLVDNGSSHALLLESIGDSAFPVPKKTIPANLGVGINGDVVGLMGRLPSLKIKDFVFHDILAGFPTFSQERNTIEGVPRNGSLGADVLKHFIVTFDYPNEAIYLKKSNAYRKRFEHDMSGIELYVLDNHYFISRVESGSSAEEVGLLAEDEILAVDFKSVSSYTLNDITELFHSQEGRQLLIEIARKGERRVVILKLKRRI